MNATRMNATRRARLTRSAARRPRVSSKELDHALMSRSLVKAAKEPVSTGEASIGEVKSSCNTKIDRERSVHIDNDLCSHCVMREYRWDLFQVGAPLLVGVVASIV